MKAPVSAPVSGARTGAAEPQPVLTLGRAVALIVGLVIGAGIFKAPALVAGMTDGGAWMYGAWLAGGAVTLIGALCYAELALAYPSAGGDYHFLHRAYGPRLAFLYGWARFSVVTTGSIALLAFVFGDYLSQLLPLAALGDHASAAWAAAAVLALALVNLRGLHSGTTAQAWLTALEVGGLLLVVGAGLVLAAGGIGSGAPPATAAAAAPSLQGLSMAMVFVLLTYGGWNEAAYLSAELQQRERNMPRALLLSIGLITALYLLVVWAYQQGLGGGLAASQAPAADLLGRVAGRPGEALVSLLVAVAALTSINATLIVGARSTYALGRDWPLLARLGQWDAARGGPTVGLLTQAAMALALVAVGAAAGGGFRAMVEFTAPVFWLFFLLAGASLIVLRVRDPSRPRPYRVPLYPLLPLAFCAVCAGMLASSLSYVYDQQFGGWNAAWIGVAVLLAGVALLPLVGSPRRQGPALLAGGGRSAAVPIARSGRSDPG